jgi:release factor glutamine methyltransferase
MRKSLNSAFLLRKSAFLSFPTRKFGLAASDRFEITSEKSSQLTVRQAHNRGKTWLEEKGISEAEESSRYFLSHLKEIGNYRYSAFKENLDKSLSTESLSQYSNMINERATSKPIQYILGNWDFYDKTFLCREPVLCPRPETEELVELILKSLPEKKKALNILDIGSGTGIIGITLCDHIVNIGKVVAIDIGEEAYNLTNENADIILSPEKRTHFQCLHIDFLSFLTKYPSFRESFDIIVSNPPYIPSYEMAGLQPEVRLFEDHRALDGGDDGLDIAKQIIMHSSKLLKPEGERTLWLELHAGHPRQLQERMSSESLKVTIYSDFGGLPRFVKILFK